MIRSHIIPRTGIFKLKQALDAYSARQRVIAENIANVQTPGYRSRRVTFEENLRRAFQRRINLAQVPNPPRSIPIGTVSMSPIKVVESADDYSNGVNNVNLEKEMTEMVETNLSYNLVARLLKGRIEMLRAAITGKVK